MPLFGVALLVPAFVVGVNAAVPGFESFFVARLLLAFLLIFTGICLFLRKDFRKNIVKVFYNNKILFLPTIFLLINFFSISWAPIFTTSVRYTFLMFSGISFFYLIVFWINSEDKRAIIYRMLMFATIISLIVAFGEIINQYFRMPSSNLVDLPERFLMATTSFFHNQNDFSSFLSVMLPVFLAPLFLSKSKKYQYFGLTSSFLALFVSSFNNSRANLIASIILGSLLLIYLIRHRTNNVANWLVVIGAFVVYLLFFLSNSKIIYIDGFLPIIIGLIFLIIILYEIFSNKDTLPHLIIFLMIILYAVPSFGLGLKSALSSTLETKPKVSVEYNEKMNSINLDELENEGENSLSIRTNMMKNTFLTFNDNKLRYFIGVGAGGIESYMANFNNTGGIKNLHNWWLEIFANLGLIGAAIIAYFSIFLFSKNFRLFHRQHDIYSFFATFSLLMLALAALSPSSLTWQIYPWFIYSFAAVNYLINKDKDENTNNISSIPHKRK